MLQHPDLGFRARFRIKLAEKLLNREIILPDINSNNTITPEDTDLSLKESVQILRALRNVIKDFKVWLKVDQLIQRSILTDSNADDISKEDIFDTINTLAFREVQSIQTWQFLSTKFVGKLQDQL